MIVAIMTTALSGTVWAETVTWTISGVNTTASGGSNVNTTLKTSAISPNTETGVWTAVASSSYAGSNSGAQLGSGSYTFAGTVTLSGSAIPSDATITRIDINLSSSGTAYKIDATVGGSAFGSQVSVNQKDAKTYSFTGTGTGNNIQLTFSNGGKKNVIIKSISVTYSTGGSSLTASDLALTGAPITLNFDLYNNASAQTVSYTTSSTGAVAVSGGEGYVTTSVNGNTITVTPVAVTSAPQTITVSQAADDTYAAGTATFTVSVADSTPFTGGDVTFDATTDKGTNSSGSGSITKQVVKMSCTSCNLSDGSAYRLYSGSTTTFATTQGKITKIVFTMANGYASTLLSTTTGSYNNGTWTGSATSVSFSASAQARASQIVVTVTPDGAVAEPTITGTTPFLDNTEVTITAEDGATIYYTTDGNDPTASSTQYTGAFTVSTTTTVKAIAVEDNNTSSVAEATFTKATVMTVAEARAAIDALGANETILDAYVSGIVSQVDSYSDKYSSITYWISDDGTTTNQLEVYSGKGIDGADFSDINGVQEGDVVVVLGTLKLFGSTYEFDKNSVIVRLTTKADPELAFATTEYTVAPGAEFTTPILTNPNNLTVTYASSDDNLAVVDETTGEVLIGDEEGTVTITASFAGDATYRAGSASYTISIIDNTKGTFDNPYTVGDVIAGKVTRENVYVIGYIVGEFRGSNQAPYTSGFTTDANIALADEFTTSPTAALSIPVALPTDALKTAWGCKTNDGSTIGTKVIVCGNGESYFSVNGIKSTSSVTAVQSVTVSSAGYATFASDNALDFTGSSIKAFFATESAGTLSFTQVNKVPAGTGVLLYADGGATVDVPVFTGEADAVTNNVFVRGAGAAVTYTDNDQNYILFNGEDGIGFYRANNNTVATNRAYIHVANGQNVKGFAIDLEDDATGISLMEDGRSQMEDGAIYNVAGQRISKMQKGINIVNGKKILK